MALALVLLPLAIAHPVVLACIPLPQLQLLQVHVRNELLAHIALALVYFLLVDARCVV